MTKQFTTPCYVRIDDAQQRKEVCEKLEQMGYDKHYVNDFGVNGILCDLNSVYALKLDVSNFCNLDNCFDCGTNIALSLDLACMRSETLRRIT